MLAPMEQEILDIIIRALHEDIGRGDVTVAATIPVDAKGSFRFVVQGVCESTVVALVHCCGS